jgi:putative DNA-invertase from lambdoid prophage Rac
MKIYGYIRVSSQMQVEKGQSLREQKRQITGYAGTKNRKVDRLFTERGVSAGIELRKRPEGSQLLELVEEGDIIICSKLDRMFRSCLDGLMVLKKLKERGVELHFIDLGGNCTTNGIGQMMFSIMSSFAEMERSRMGERISQSKQLLKSEDRYFGGPVPFGYKLQQVGDRQYMDVDKEQQQYIRQMKKLRREGFTLRQVSSKLGSRGLQLSHTGVSLILRDEMKHRNKFRRVQERIRKM